MCKVINPSVAESALKHCGYEPTSVRQINEGSNHYVFDVVLSDKKRAICKFSKTRITEEDLYEENKDTLFGGQLSLKREAYLFQMIREKAKVPTPKVYGIHNSPYGEFILLEHMDGISQKECMIRSGFSKRIFLDSMEFLGRDFAKIQTISFESFGNIMNNSTIEPAGIRNFSDRFLEVMNMRLERCIRKKVFSKAETAEVKYFFDTGLKKLRPLFDSKTSPPVLVFTDMHAENFFTDLKGKPSGYFDLESAQAAPAALEFYGFRFFLYNFYDDSCFREAEEAFWHGYKTSGGKFAPLDSQEEEAIDFLAGCRLLELSQSYWGYIDGIRDTWGQEMKHLLFSYMGTGRVDYNAIGAIWRQRDGQPLTPQRK